ncbi:MAG: hypothetical protein HEP71_20680 [Roseivirga sp.]|nr:hypothetical protein [Roseivirga sp.]
MKSNLKPLALALLIACFSFSCGSDDGGGIDTNLFGTWTLTATVLRDCANPNDNSTTNEVCDTQTCVSITMTDDLRYERVELIRGQPQTVRGQIQIGETQIRFLPDNSTGSELLDYQLTASSLTLSNVTVICTEDFRYSK